MVAPVTAWSYSRLAKWEECPAAFKYRNIDKYPEPQSPPMKRGDEIHQNVAAILTDQPLPFPDADVPKKLGNFVNVFGHIKANQPLVEQKWAFDKNWRTVSYFDKATHYRSILDVGVLWPNNKFTVVDWKTGKAYGSNIEQMEQFAMAVMRRYPQVHSVETRLMYLDTGQEQHEEFVRSQLGEISLKWDQRVAPLMADTVFTPRPGEYCRRCHFRKSNGGPCAFG